MPESKTYDAIVIGSGVCGALVANELAKAGARVLLLEGGQEQPDRVNMVGQYARSSNKFSLHGPYASPENDKFSPSPDGATDYFDQPSTEVTKQFKSTYERIGGGTTWHWLGHTPRLLPNDFRLQTAYQQGVDWPLSYEDVEPWYCRAEHELGVAGDNDEWANVLGATRSKSFPMSKVWPSVADDLFATSLRGKSIEGFEFKVRSTPSARNTEPYDGRPVCAGNSTCIPICPIQAKYDATVHLKKAAKNRAEILYRRVVTKLKRGPDGRIDSVEFRTWDNEAHQATARIYVVAANSIETPKLLLLSADEAFPNGLANSSDQVGRNLMDHLQAAMLGIAQKPVFPFRGPPVTSGIEEMRDGPFRKDHGAIRFSVGNDGWSRAGSPLADLNQFARVQKLYGEQLRQSLRTIQNQLRMSCSTETLPNCKNRVTLSTTKVDGLNIPVPHIEFAPDEYTTSALALGVSVMTQILTAVGATQIHNPDPVPGNYSGAGHIMGTCRMGDDRTKSVVNADCRSHDHENLFIVGAGVFASSGTANPTLTAAALTLKAIEAMKEQIQP